MTPWAKLKPNKKKKKQHLRTYKDTLLYKVLDTDPTLIAANLYSNKCKTLPASGENGP